VSGEHPDVVNRLSATMKAAYRPHENWKMPNESGGPSSTNAKKPKAAGKAP
jgi:hypothetical protein